MFYDFKYHTNISLNSRMLLYAYECLLKLITVDALMTNDPHYLCV